MMSLLDIILLLTTVFTGGKEPLVTKEQVLPSSPPFYPSPWMDAGAIGWEDAYVKASEFVGKLTLLEKVNLTTGVGWQGEKCVGNVGSIPRLGLRSLCMQDSPVGVRSTDLNSVFSSGQSVAATFDRGLFYARGYAMGEEHKQKGVTVQLGPVAGPLGRAPAGGRNWEGFSPDPYLTGVAIAETVKGTQDAGVVACAKHFIGNEQEHFRQAGEAQVYGYNISESISSNIDDVTMHELYLWPFADAVRAGVGSIMCSYNQINNSYGCQNSKLLNNILKDELGFQGFVMSDWSAQHSGASSALAGLDMSMPGDVSLNDGNSYWGANLTLAVLNGTVPEWRIDDMVMRIMSAYFKVGLTLDEPPINFSSWTLETNGSAHASAGGDTEQVNSHVDVQGNHSILIRNIGARSTVLLKNTRNALPLDKPQLLAVFGDDARSPDKLNGCIDGGCDDGTLALGWGSGSANFPYLISPDEALRNQTTLDGTSYESILSNYASNITSLASKPNVTAIVFVNSDSGEGYLNVSGNVGDRQNLTLWYDGDALIETVAAHCNNTIVVIHSTGPVLVPWHTHPNITAILWAGLPGQESGNSITDVLYGKVNPAARTPFTWGATRESYGADILLEPNNGNEAPQSDFREGIHIDYRAFDRANSTPIWEFGHGLSYTTFEYSSLAIIPVSIAMDRSKNAGNTVTAPVFGNFSDRSSDYLYPDGFSTVEKYVYPYLKDVDAKKASRDPSYGQQVDLPTNATQNYRTSTFTRPGGDPSLWDVLFTVHATITNTGLRNGEEVAQLYLSLGGNAPKVMLRGFERLSIDASKSTTFVADVTRRDISRWNTTSQRWVLQSKIGVYVGGSSRNLPLQGEWVL